MPFIKGKSLLLDLDIPQYRFHFDHLSLLGHDPSNFGIAIQQVFRQMQVSQTG